MRDVHRRLQLRLVRRDGDVLARGVESPLLGRVDSLVLRPPRVEPSKDALVDSLSLAPVHVADPRDAPREAHQALALAPPLHALRLHHGANALDVLGRVSVPLIVHPNAPLAHQLLAGPAIHDRPGVFLHRVHDRAQRLISLGAELTLERFQAFEPERTRPVPRVAPGEKTRGPSLHPDRVHLHTKAERTGSKRAAAAAAAVVPPPGEQRLERVGVRQQRVPALTGPPRVP